MGCLTKLIITLVGFVGLAAGGFLLYTSFIDSPDVRTDTLGGASQTQQQIAVNNEGAEDVGQLDLPVVVDGAQGSSNNVGVVELSPDEVSDIVNSPERVESVLDEDPDLAAALADDRVTQAAEAVAASSGTNVVLENEVLNTDTQVAVRSFTGVSVPVSDDGGRTESTDGQGGGGMGAGIEQRVVEFEWPEEFRTGEAGSIRLTLKALPSGGLEATVAEIPTNAVIATPILMTDCYDEYTATVTATIIAPAFDIETTTNDTQPLNRGSEVTWRWSLTPDEEGTFIITLAINLSWAAKQEGIGSCGFLEAQSPLALWGQSVQVETTKVLGFISIRQASIAGTVLAVVGFVAELPFMGEIFGVLFERRLESRADRKRQRQAAKDAKRRR